MYFKRLEMHGFKSFSEPVVIEFHEGVTCIVGPNGSGKSNISDAIRWVLGEQSPKTLRGGKMEEVIFAGTANRKSRGMAEVTLVIDNSNCILDIDYNEVAITRRMFRSGESEYLINNNQCRLRDIRELIMDTGIGVDGYSIIGQGRIADIVSNKAENRREIFEEAAGVVMYKNKKSEAERKLASTGNNLDRVNDIIGEIEGRIDGLRDDSEKAKEYLELKDKYQNLEINITLKNIENFNSRNKVFKEDIENLEKEIHQYESEKETGDKESEDKRNRRATLEELGSRKQDEILALTESINQIVNRKELNRERLSTIEKDRARLEREKSDIDIKLEKELKNFRELKQGEKELATQYERASITLKEKIDVFNEVTEKSTVLSKAIEDNKNRLFQLHNNLAAKNSEAKSIENLKETLLRRRNQIREEREDIIDNTRQTAEILEKSLEVKEQLDAEIDKLQGELAQSVEKQNNLTAMQRSNRVAIEEIKIKGGRISARKKTIEEMEHNYEGYNFGVKTIMKASLPGVEGVVAELMEVPEKLQVAVETALGGSLQNIVCDTDDHAKNAVNYLKQQNGGRLTFLPVESIKGNRGTVDSRVTGSKNCIGIATECISFDSRYDNIFDYLLGRVVIVSDMDAAISLSKLASGGLRLVTLDGEIINASGAITGGRYKNKSANLLERKNEIATLQKELDRMKKELKDREDDYRVQGDELISLGDKISSLSVKKGELEISLAAEESRISEVERTCRDIHQSQERYEKELESIDREASEATNMITKLVEDGEKIETEIKSLTESIEESTAKQAALKNTVDAASEDITAWRIKASEWETKKENMEALSRRVQESIEDYELQIDDRENQLTALEEESNRIAFDDVKPGNDAETLIEKKQSLEEEISIIAAEKVELAESLDSYNRAQKELGDKLNAVKDQKYQLEIKAARNETQLDTLKNRLWEEFEISYAQALDFKDPDFVMSSSVRESREIRDRIRELGDVNIGAIKEYDSVSERYRFLTEQREDINLAAEQLHKIIREMDTTIRERFKETFDQVVDNFEAIFVELFGGGTAELRLEDGSNPLESGIEIVAQPPGKKLQNINLMSGGEKTMTAIALMFAVLRTKPTPFCILDEVEAALDDLNIDRFANYLRRFNEIQFTLITHQKATMEHADVLYGVTMAEHGVSKVISLRLGDDFEI